MRRGARRFAYLILLSITGFLSFAAGRVGHPFVIQQRVLMPDSMIGYTYCQAGAPRSILDATIFEDSDTLLGKETIAHERTHRAQMLDDCERSMAVYQTPRGKLSMEAQAYCVGLLTVTPDGTTAYRLRRRDAVGRLRAETAGDGWSDGTADAALTKAGCPS